MDSMLTPSPKKSKRLPNNVPQTTSQQKPTTPSIMTAAGAGLSSLFSSLSNTLQSPSVTTASSFISTSPSIMANNAVFSNVYTPTTNYTFSSAYSPTTSSYMFSSAYTPVTTSAIFSSVYMATTTSSIFVSPYTPMTTSSIFTSAFAPSTTSSIFSSAYTPTNTSSIFTSAYSPVTSSFDTAITCYASTDYNVSFTSSYTSAQNLSTTYASTYSTSILSDNFSSNLASTTVFDPPLSNYETTKSYSQITDYNLPDNNYNLSDNSYNLLNDSYNLPDSNYASSVVPTTCYVKETPPVTTSAPSSSLFGALSSLFDIGVATTTATTTTTTTTSTMASLYNSTSSEYTLESTGYGLNSSLGNHVTSSYGVTPSYGTTTSYNPTSLYNNPTTSYNPTMSLGILGHSPIPEEEDIENEAMYEETYPETTDPYTPYTTVDDYKISVDTTSSYATSNGLNLTSSYLPSISDPYYATSSIYDTAIDEKLEEEYREDYEEGVLPIPITSSDLEYSYPPSTTVAITAPQTTVAHDDYFYENSTYPMTSKLSTIPETANDIYLSNTDLQEEEGEVYAEQLTTPGAYDYTENENDYIASGDLKNTNLYQPTYSQSLLGQQTTSAATTLTATTSASSQQAQPEQKKSRFGLGSLFSDGLNVIGSSVNTIKSTATNLAGGAVGVVGGVVGAAAAAAQSSSSQNMGQTISQNQTSLGQSQNTTSGPSMTSQSSIKLTKQVSEMYDEQQEDYMDPYGAKQQQVCRFC